MTVTGSTIISGNTAGSGGGIANWGTAAVTSSTISQNDANYYGGGIDNYCGTTTITSSTISSNTAWDGSGIYSGGDYNNGIITLATLNVMGSTIPSNSGTREHSDCDPYGTCWVSGGSGGGISNSLGSTATITGSTISSNKVIEVGGGIENYWKMTITSSTVSLNGGIGDISVPLYSYGGGIYNGVYYLDNNPTPATLIVQGDSSISNNFVSGYGSTGGGIYSTSSLVTIDGTKVAVKSNSASQPSPSELSWYQGWGVYLTTGTPTTKNGFNPATQVTGNTHI